METVRILSEHHDRTGYREVGFVNASGGSFDAAVERAKEVGAEHGCLALGVESESSDSKNAPGSAWGGSKTTVRFTCLVPSATGKPLAATSASASACVPACRSGYECIDGTCVSACNPRCPEGRTCVGHGEEAMCVSE